MVLTYVLPRSSTTMSFHGLVETAERSACVTRDPSGSRRSSRGCAESTTSIRPSGRKSMHIGTTRRSPRPSGCRRCPVRSPGPRPSQRTRAALSCQRGDSPKTTPSIRTSATPTWTSPSRQSPGNADRAGLQNSPPTPPVPPRPLLSLLLRRHPGRPRPGTRPG